MQEIKLYYHFKSINGIIREYTVNIVLDCLRSFRTISKNLDIVYSTVYTRFSKPISILRISIMVLLCTVQSHLIRCFIKRSLPCLALIIFATCTGQNKSTYLLVDAFVEVMESNWNLILADGSFLYSQIFKGPIQYSFFPDN